MDQTRQRRLTRSGSPSADLARFLTFRLGMLVADDRSVASQKKFVYVIRSLSSRDRYYTGATYDVASRLCSHNAGECVHTAWHVPWELDLVMAFRDEARALEFERYLKSTSGCAFAERHLR